MGNPTNQTQISLKLGAQNALLTPPLVMWTGVNSTTDGVISIGTNNTHSTSKFLHNAYSSVSENK